MIRLIRNISVVILLVAVLLAAVPTVLAASMPQDEASPVYIYFFWGDGCPHCAQAKPFLENLAQRYPTVEVLSYEVWYDDGNQALFQQMATAHGFEPQYVPTIFVGEQVWQGFGNPLRDSITAAVQACVESGCPDAGAGVAPGHAAPTNSDGLSEAEVHELPIYLFYGDAGCAECAVKNPHLAANSGFAQVGADSGIEARRFLEALAEEHPQLALSSYEVWTTATYVPRFQRVAEAFGTEAKAVPTIFVGERVWEGFTSDTATDLTAYVQECLTVGCPGPLDSEADPKPTPTPVSTVAPTPAPPVGEEEPSAPTEQVSALTLPLLGTVELGGQSLWASTALISFVDGFNPCSLWVLSILIALTLRTGSRKRIFTIGLIYITVTAAIYVLFIAGLFTFLTVVSFLTWIQVAVSILALFFAVINIKDYFWYKEGLSFTISDEQKPGIYKRMRKVLHAGDSFWALAGATVALGAGVSFVEFSCTAGFPVIWTNLVAAQDVTPVTFGLLLLLYMVIYQIDELAIFGVAVITLKANRLEEKHGRMLKLVGGTLMLTLAAVMLIQPALMNNLGSSLLIFGGALVLALVIMVIHRRLLPKMGIYVGTELASSRE